MYQKNMVAGNDMIYLTLPVKLNNRNMFPTNPHIRETTFSQYTHLGSAYGVPESCGPGFPVPSSMFSLQYDTRAAIENTFARGPNVAAVKLENY